MRFVMTMNHYTLALKWSSTRKMFSMRSAKRCWERKGAKTSCRCSSAYTWK